MRSVFRRQALSSLVTGCVGLLAGCFSFFGGMQSDEHEVSRTVDISGTWPSVHFDAANTRYTPSATGPRSGVEEAWRYCLPRHSHIHGIVVHSGTIYANEEETLRAHDARDGAVEWEREKPGLGYSSPTVTEDTVYLAKHGDPPVLEALARADGSVEWSSELGGQTLTHPTGALVHDGTVYVISGGSDVGALQAFSTADGSERFRVERDLSSSMGAAADTLLVITEDGSLVALSTADGSERWRVETERGQFSNQTIANGTVYVTHASERTPDLRALRLTDGTQLWRTTVETGTELYGLAVGNGAVYAAAYRDVADGSTIAYDVDDGTRRWQLDGLTMHVPTVTDGTVYAADQKLGVTSVKGRLYALEPDDGSVRWRHGTGRQRGGPVVVDDAVVLATEPRDYSKNFDCLRVLA